MPESKTQFDTELAKFDPQVAELKKIAETAKALTITDFKDKNQLKLVHDKRIELKQIRVNITKTGKALRDDANAFNKAVLLKEKEMVGVIQPEEERLEQLETEAERLAEVEKRKENLPVRKARLNEIGDEIEISDQGILEMDDQKFESYINQRVANWNLEQKARLDAERKAEDERKAKEAEEDRLKKEAEEKKRAEDQAKLDAEKAKLEEDKREFEKQKEIDAAKKEAEAKAKAEAEAEAERKEKARLEKEAADKAKAEEEAKAEEARKKKEADALKKREAYQNFLKDHGWSKETQAEFYLLDSEKEVVLYKKVGTFTK